MLSVIILTVVSASRQKTLPELALKPAILASTSVGVPISIQIPSIKVDAKIERVAKTIAGAMDVPKLPANVGWYELGPRPGEVGSATIAGHFDNIYGLPAVFANLAKIKPGNEVNVTDDGGVVIVFVVREVKELNANADATDVFSSTDGRSHLNLITCDGVWDKKASEYTSRLVVFADKKI